MVVTGSGVVTGLRVVTGSGAGVGVGMTTGSGVEVGTTTGSGVEVGTTTGSGAELGMTTGGAVVTGAGPWEVVVTDCLTGVVGTGTGTWVVEEDLVNWRVLVSWPTATALASGVGEGLTYSVAITVSVVLASQKRQRLISRADSPI